MKRLSTFLDLPGCVIDRFSFTSDLPLKIIRVIDHTKSNHINNGSVLNRKPIDTIDTLRTIKKTRTGVNLESTI